MTLHTPQDLEREASEWFARLHAQAVTAGDLEAFRAWRSDPARRRAYEKLEGVWRASGALSADPEIIAAVSRAAAPRRRALRGRTLALAAAAAVAVGFVAVALLSTPRSLVYETGAGERRSIQLADGSQLQLDASSRVRVQFTDEQRALRLERGQALFDVETDPERPFRVLSGDTSVTAIGTRFDVRRDGTRTRVTLVEGAVVVRASVRGEPTERTWRLQPGQQIATGGDAASSPKAVDPAAVTSWTEGRLVFDATPLAEAVGEVNRYASDPIALGPGVDGRTPISGVFNAGDPRAFAEAVAALHGLGVETRPDSLRLISRPENKS